MRVWSVGEFCKNRFGIRILCSVHANCNSMLLSLALNNTNTAEYIYIITVCILTLFSRHLMQLIPLKTFELFSTLLFNSWFCHSLFPNIISFDLVWFDLIFRSLCFVVVRFFFIAFASNLRRIWLYIVIVKHEESTSSVDTPTQILRNDQKWLWKFLRKKDAKKN